MIKLFIKEHSSAILTAGAGVGVVGTAYLAALAGMRQSNHLSEQDPWMSNRERASRVWKFYIPAGAAGATTIVLIYALHHGGERKALAASTALAVSQRAYEGYRAQVIEELGERKDKAFAGKAAEARVAQTEAPALVIGTGEIGCFEGFTGRYFVCDMNKLQAAVNEINSKMLKHDYATLDDFYYELGLPYTKISGSSGWSSDKLLELEYSSVLHEGKPYLAFEYNYVKSL